MKMTQEERETIENEEKRVQKWESLEQTVKKKEEQRTRREHEQLVLLVTNLPPLKQLITNSINKAIKNMSTHVD